jgi:iron uptake system EfeUOB component EfeO/EfeM
MRSLAQIRTNGEEERYSHSDLNGFASNLEGTRKVIDLLRPLLAKSAAELPAKLDSATASLEQQLAALNGVAYDQVDAAQRQQIADKAKALADLLDTIDPALGLSDL